MECQGEVRPPFRTELHPGSEQTAPHAAHQEHVGKSTTRAREGAPSPNKKWCGLGVSLPISTDGAQEFGYRILATLACTVAGSPATLRRLPGTAHVGGPHAPKVPLRGTSTVLRALVIPGARGMIAAMLVGVALVARDRMRHDASQGAVRVMTGRLKQLTMRHRGSYKASSPARQRDVQSLESSSGFIRRYRI